LNEKLNEKWEELKGILKYYLEENIYYQDLIKFEKEYEKLIQLLYEKGWIKELCLTPKKLVQALEEAFPGFKNSPKLIDILKILDKHSYLLSNSEKTDEEIEVEVEEMPNEEIEVEAKKFSSECSKIESPLEEDLDLF